MYVKYIILKIYIIYVGKLEGYLNRYSNIKYIVRSSDGHVIFKY